MNFTILVLALDRVVHFGVGVATLLATFGIMLNDILFLQVFVIVVLHDWVYNICI